MSFDPDRVRTVTFDSYSTLVDVDAAETALADRVPDPEPVSRLWRSRSLAYTFVANAIDAYQPFDEMNRDALTYALAAHNVNLAPAERDEILAVSHELEVFDDVRFREEIPKTATGKFDKKTLRETVEDPELPYAPSEGGSESEGESE